MFLRKRITGSLLALAFVFTLCFPVAALADTSPTVTRLAGYDRYETAAEIAKSGWSQSDYTVLAYGENYPDALASVPLSYKYDAPILLTRSNSMPEVTKQAISDLQVKNVIIIGGTGVIYASVEEELEAMGINVSRVFGYDKYETAVEVAKQITEYSDFIDLFVVTGEDYPDALSVGSIAGFKQMPIILVASDGIPDSVKNYVSSVNVNKSYVIGYSDVISDQVYNEFPGAERILGADKYARNIAVNQKFENEFKAEKICLATGEVFADALSGGAYAAKIGEPIILVNNDPPANTKSYYYQRKAVGANNAYVFGGTGIIPESVIDNLNQGITAQDESVYPTGISLNKSKATIPVGESETLTAKLEMSNGVPVSGDSTNVTWTSSNTDIATVKQGEVIGVSKGIAVITAETKIGGKTASCRVEVGNDGVVYTYTLTLSDLEIGETEATFKYQAFSNNQDITWKMEKNIVGKSSIGSVSLNPRERKGVITFNSSVDKNTTFDVMIIDINSGLHVTLCSTSGPPSVSATHYEYLPPEPDSGDKYTIGKIEITSTTLGVVESPDGSVRGYASYEVFSLNGEIITKSGRTNEIIFESGAGTIDARNGLITLTPGKGIDLYELPSVVISARDPVTGVSTAASLTIVWRVDVIE